MRREPLSTRRRLGPTYLKAGRWRTRCDICDHEFQAFTEADALSQWLDHQELSHGPTIQEEP